MTSPAAIAARPDADVHTFDGRVLTVAVALEVVLETERGNRAGRLIRTHVLDARSGVPLTRKARSGLLASDFERIDVTALSRARAVLGEGGGPAMMEVSFVTASSQRARPGLAQAAASLRELCGGQLIWLLTDLPANAPPARLGEALTFLRAQGRSVFASLDSAAASRSLRGAPLGGVAVSAPDVALTERDTALWLLNAARGLEANAPAVRIACGLSNPADLAGLAAAAGFSHVSGKTA